ncbi:MAG: DUF2959 family protein [Gammaproteobacteria bacterium]|nr:DUF2959 family protein [Gammaproteobacteria bacterium]
MLCPGGCQTAELRQDGEIPASRSATFWSSASTRREAKQEAKEQLASALDKFIAVTGYEGGDLEEQYNILKDEYDASLARAEDIKSRIVDVKDVADSLFAEWNEELGKYTDPNLKRASAQQLKSTQASCTRSWSRRWMRRRRRSSRC